MHGNQKQTHWAYIAGIMDADGCFMIMKRQKKTLRKNTVRKNSGIMPFHKEEWSKEYLPCVKICMIEIEAIAFIKNDMEFGNYLLDGARKDRVNSKPIYHWYIRGSRPIISFLKGVIPYLKVKKNRAEHLLNFAEHMIEYGRPGYRGIDENELNYREEAYRKAREFNGNKVAATTEPQSSERRCDSLIS